MGLINASLSADLNIGSDIEIAIMGNHEYNALCYHTEDPDKPDTYLRSHIQKNVEQHQAFLNEYQSTPSELEDTLNWFMTLPMWLEIDGIRVVHACWDTNSFELLKNNHSDKGFISKNLPVL